VIVSRELDDTSWKSSARITIKPTRLKAKTCPKVGFTRPFHAPRAAA